jgi:predicted MFS family arabinose efflux permease
MGGVAGRVRGLRLAGGLVFAAGQALYASRVVPVPDYLWIWLPAQIVTGMGIGMALPGLGAGSVASLTPRNFAMGGAINNALRQFGGAVGAALAVVLVGSPAAQFRDFQIAFCVIAGLGLLTAILSLRSRPVEAKPLAEAHAPGATAR